MTPELQLRHYTALDGTTGPDQIEVLGYYAAALLTL